MADAEGDEGGQWERIRSIRRVRELFGGRFTDADVKTLLMHFNWDLGDTVNFILEGTPQEMRQVLGENDWEVVSFVRRNNVIRELARRNEVATEIRQFACMECPKMWWRKVPTRKLVSRCHSCKKKFDALPRDKEWGWARFICPHPCNNEFRAFGAMDVSLLGEDLYGKSKSICYKCEAHLCEPLEIYPPIKRTQRGRARNTHWCNAPNCFNRHPVRYIPLVPICVHPKSLRRDVVYPSKDHVSTGSTVNTFLSQDELAPPHAPYEPSLADISEDGADNM